MKAELARKVIKRQRYKFLNHQGHRWAGLHTAKLLDLVIAKYEHKYKYSPTLEKADTNKKTITDKKNTN